MAPWFSPFSTLHQAQAAFQTTFPSLKPLLTILIWSKNNKRPLCLAHQVYRLAITGIKHGPGKELPLWARRAYVFKREKCVYYGSWIMVLFFLCPLQSNSSLLWPWSTQQGLWTFSVPAQVSLPLTGAPWQLTGLLPPPNILSYAWSNLVLVLRSKSFCLRQMSNLYFVFILLLVITPLCDLHDKRWTRSLVDTSN